MNTYIIWLGGFLVQINQTSEKFPTETAISLEIHNNSECIRKHFFSVVSFFNRIDKDVHSPGFDGDTHGLLELLVFEAFKEHSVDNAFHSCINFVTRYSLIDVSVNTGINDLEKENIRHKSK